MGDMSVEPSMEEILSSIKRIIAEEGDGPTRGRRLSRPVPPPRDDADDSAEVLELSDPIPGPAPVSRPEPAFERPDPVLRIEPRIEAARTVPPRVEPAPPPAPPTPEPVASRAAPPEPEPIISASTAEASRGSLESLSRVLVKPDPASDGTLEGLVRDMLRPMLREWLDRNLPAMVETLVADEIARITGQPR